MKFKINAKEKKIIAFPEGVDDLWHLEKIITPGAFVTGRTTRVYRPRPDAVAQRKPVMLTLATEKIDFSKYGVNLRVTGKITKAVPEEYAQVGTYHTIEIKPGDKIIIQKQITSADMNRLRTAVKNSQKIKVGIAICDDESTVFSKVMTYCVEQAAEVYSHTSKMDPNYAANFMKYISEIVKTIETLFPEGKIIVGGPGFTKDSLKKYIQKNNETLTKRIIFTNTSVPGASGVNEVIKNQLSKIIKEHQLTKETNLLETAMMHISKDDGLCVYGIENVLTALECGAVEKLLVHEELVKRRDVHGILTIADKKKVNYTLFSSESDSGRKLKGISGLVAILRFRIA
jgi:mRNA surveillance protein pelota